jgi:hypothetical protein
MRLIKNIPYIIILSKQFGTIRAKRWNQTNLLSIIIEDNISVLHEYAS